MKIKKMYQGTVPENKILNTHSDSQTDVYSCDYVNRIGKMLWLKKTSPQAITPSTTTRVDYDTVYSDTSDGCLYKGDNNFIVIGDNVKSIQIKANYRIENDARAFIYIGKNSELQSSYFGDGGMLTINDIMQVSKGDKIGIYCYIQTAQTISGSSNSEFWDFFKVMVIA